MLERLGLAARGRLHAGRRARPPRRAAERDRARGRRPRALRDRDPPPAAHRGARGRRSRSAPGRRAPRAMPHKRNPIKSEQISGLARVLRGNAQAALENVALWHERDISHSSVERVILPDSTILLDYLQHRAIALVRGHDRRRRADAREPRADPRRAVLPARAARARRGAACTRDDAYRSSRSWPSAPGTRASPLRELLAADERAAGPRPRRDLRLRRTTCATPRRSSRASTRSPERPRSGWPRRHARLHW